MIGQKQSISYARVAAILELLRGYPLERLNYRKMAQAINDLSSTLLCSKLQAKATEYQLYYGSKQQLLVLTLLLPRGCPMTVAIDSKDDFAQNDYRQTKKGTDL